LPCSCGGIINRLSWPQHLVLNVVLTALTALAYITEQPYQRFIAINRNRRTPVKESRQHQSSKFFIMKKYLLGIFAVMLAIAATAFTVKPAHATNVYFWYDAETKELMSSTPSELPPTGCQLTGGVICAFGHVDEVPANTDPAVGYDEIARFQ
jgi:hypothetical protein